MIDLGELGHEPAPPPRDRFRYRWLLIALMVAPLAGAAPAPSPALPWTPQAQDVALAANSLYAVTDPEQGSPSPPTTPTWVLTRYDLPDGAVRWTTPLGHHDGAASVELAGAVPMVATTRAGIDLTTGFDPDTGRPRWRQGGWPVRAVDDRVVLHRRSSLAAVEVRTGEIAWTIPLDGTELQMYGWAGRPTGPPSVLVLLGHGRLSRYDLATGTMAATAELPRGRPFYPAVGGSLPSALQPPQPAVADGVVLLSELGGDPAVVAYDLTTLTPRWRLPGHAWAAPCGPVVCAVTEDLFRLAGVDPRTGSVRWSWSCRAHGAPSRTCYVLPSALGPADPILVQQWRLSRGGADTAWLVDPATGADVAELGQWRVMGRIDQASWLLRWVDEDEPVYGLRAPPERIWLARLSVDPLSINVLGSIESPALPELVWLHARAGGGGRA